MTLQLKEDDPANAPLSVVNAMTPTLLTFGLQHCLDGK
jgi:hypothetical protein